MSRKLREPDALFKYYCDFDLGEVKTESADGTELHVDVSDADGSPCKHFDETFATQLLNRVVLLMGLNPAGCFVEYMNNAYRRYHEDGQLAAQKFFMNKKSMLDQIVKDFPQFEEAFVSRCLDCAITLDRTKSTSAGASLWPNFS